MQDKNDANRSNAVAHYGSVILVGVIFFLLIVVVGYGVIFVVLPGLWSVFCYVVMKIKLMFDAVAVALPERLVMCGKTLF